MKKGVDCPLKLTIILKHKLDLTDHEPVVVEHESYDRAKTNFSIGFAYGSLSVRDVRVTVE